MKQTFRWIAHINEVHDGDTLYGYCDQGAGIWNYGLAKAGMGLRLYGCNAIELEDPGGHEARDYLASLIPVGSVIPIDTMAWDKWQGRVDVSITLPKIGDLVTHLISQQWAAGPYYGTGPKPVPPWPRTVGR
jgi:endonuclease YncB( thermonuclease family)